MIDHFTLTVRDIASSRAFYERALAPLGFKVKMDFGKFCGFGDAKKPYFWLKEGPIPTQSMHIAFQAKGRNHVDAFHVAALAAGATDDGTPGLRKHYHPHYYGSFVIDPDGHPIEAVYHLPQKAKAKAKSKKPVKAKSKKIAAKRR